ncbi:MAG TPA: hypothetical protein VKS78_07315 [Roseiarcus sp.]|nr:hypothetical protein [Roseiarcus sp.]
MRKIITVLLLGVVGWVGVEAVSLASASAAADNPKKATISPLALTTVGVFKTKSANADRLPARAVRLIPAVAKPRLAAMGDKATLHQEPAKLSALGRSPAVASERVIGLMKNVRGSADFRALAIASSAKPMSGDATAREMTLSGVVAPATNRVLLSTLRSTETRERTNTNTLAAAASALSAKAEVRPVTNGALLVKLTSSERHERGYAPAASGALSTKAELGPATDPALLAKLTPSERRERGYAPAASGALLARADLGSATNRLLLSEMTSAEPRERRNMLTATTGSLLATTKLTPAKMIGEHSTRGRVYAQAEYGPAVGVRPKHWK